jgi:hypothetical protein
VDAADIFPQCEQSSRREQSARPAPIGGRGASSCVCSELRPASRCVTDAPGDHPEPPRDLADRFPLLSELTPGTGLSRIHDRNKGPGFLGKTGRNRFDSQDASFGVLYVALDVHCDLHPNIRLIYWSPHGDPTSARPTPPSLSEYRAAFDSHRSRGFGWSHAYRCRRPLARGLLRGSPTLVGGFAQSPHKTSGTSLPCAARCCKEGLRAVRSS